MFKNVIVFSLLVRWSFAQEQQCEEVLKCTAYNLDNLGNCCFTEACCYFNKAQRFDRPQEKEQICRICVTNNTLCCQLDFCCMEHSVDAAYKIAIITGAVLQFAWMLACACLIFSRFKTTVRGDVIIYDHWWEDIRSVVVEASSSIMTFTAVTPNTFAGWCNKSLKIYRSHK